LKSSPHQPGRHVCHGVDEASWKWPFGVLNFGLLKRNSDNILIYYTIPRRNLRKKSELWNRSS
jgi:hypothetical protein